MDNVDIAINFLERILDSLKNDEKEITVARGTTHNNIPWHDIAIYIPSEGYTFRFFYYEGYGLIYPKLYHAKIEVKKKNPSSKGSDYRNYLLSSSPPTKSEVLDYIRSHFEGITAKEIAQHFKISTSKALNRLYSLKSKGVKKIGKEKGNYLWFIK